MELNLKDNNKINKKINLFNDGNLTDSYRHNDVRLFADY